MSNNAPGLFRSNRKGRSNFCHLLRGSLFTDHRGYTRPSMARGGQKSNLATCNPFRNHHTKPRFQTGPGQFPSRKSSQSNRMTPKSPLDGLLEVPGGIFHPASGHELLGNQIVSQSLLLFQFVFRHQNPRLAEFIDRKTANDFPVGTIGNRRITENQPFFDAVRTI